MIPNMEAASTSSWHAGYERQAAHLLEHRADLAAALDAGRNFLAAHAPHDLVAPAISCGELGEITLHWHCPGPEGVDLEVDITGLAVQDVYVWLHGEASSTMTSEAAAVGRLQAALDRVVRFHTP